MTKTDHNKDFNKPTKAVVIARVSSPDQEKNYSHDAQEENINHYCKSQGLNILEAFRITESSTRGERKEFKKMKKFVFSQSEPIVVVSDTIDRFQRSFDEAVHFKDRIESGRVEIHFARENLVINKNSSASDLLRWYMGIIVAKNFADNLSENVIRSQIHMAKKGKYPGKAPLGYRNEVLESGEKTIVPCFETARIVTKLFKMYSTGRYSMHQLRIEGVKYGLFTSKTMKQGISVSQVQKMLDNPFYVGRFRWGGKIYDHYYERLIDETTFLKCKKIRKSNTNHHIKKDVKAVYQFNSLIRCSDTNSVLSGYCQKGKHIYYNTSNKKSPCYNSHIPEKLLEKELEDVIDSLFISDSLKLKYIMKIRSEYRELQDSYEKVYSDAKAYISLQESKKDKLLDRNLDGSITDEVYRQKQEQINYLIREKQVELESLVRSDEGFCETVTRFIHVVSNLKGAYKSASKEAKNIILKIVLSNWSYNGKKHTVELNKVYSNLFHDGEIPPWQRYGESNSDLSLEKAAS